MKKEKSLFERDGFTMSIQKRYEGREINYTQWEAKYVSELELVNTRLLNEIKELKRTINYQMDMLVRKIGNEKIED